MPACPAWPRPSAAAIYDDLNATLARLHQVDVAAIGLADYGRPGNYFQRQIDRWIKQYRGAETRGHPGDGAADGRAARPHPARRRDRHRPMATTGWRT